MKTPFFLFLLVAVALFNASFSPDTSKKSAWLNGKWTGMKYQTNMDKAWKTELAVNTKTGTYAIFYPDLNCGGKLVPTSIRKNVAIFEERLESGNCLTGGYIIITKVDEKHISFTCFRDAEQRLASYCTLEKN